MEIQLIRNATLRVTYGGHLFLIDPFLGAKHTLRSFAGISPNPLVDLPCTPEEAVAGVEMVVVSHLHTDHFDESAQNLLPKGLPLFCQPGDEDQLVEKGFQQVTTVEQSVEWQGISITRTPGRHGTGLLAERMGNVAGFVFAPLQGARAKEEPTVYWAGDTIWYEAIEELIAEIQPDVIITHSSGAKFGDSDPIVMDAEQTVAVCHAALQAVVVAVHMESLDHGTVTRAGLRTLAESSGIRPERLRIPSDGETITF
jgi:L-ascorbate metabolism protein UlaG (beta-lactamase superfamily)